MPAPPVPVAPERSPRHRAVLEAALALIAERGYAGASLRELAARVGMRQPSLYHYFRTKEELVEQIIETFAGEMFRLPERLPPPTRLDDLPRFTADLVFLLYEPPTHPLFVRVAFSVSRSHPRFSRLMRELFVDRADALMKVFVAPFRAGSGIAERDLVMLMRMVVNAVGFRLMEEKVLFDERPIGPEVRAFADAVVETACDRIDALRRAAKRRARGRTAR